MGWLKDRLEEVGNIVEGTVGLVGAAAQGDVKEAGKQLEKVQHETLDIGALGTGDQIDAVTGGFHSAALNANATGGEFLQGESVKDNLKDAGRVGATVAAAYFGGPVAAASVNQQFAQDGFTLESLAKGGAATAFGGGYVDPDSLYGNLIAKTANAFGNEPVKKSAAPLPLVTKATGTIDPYLPAPDNTLALLLILGGAGLLLIILSKR